MKIYFAMVTLIFLLSCNKKERNPANQTLPEEVIKAKNVEKQLSEESTIQFVYRNDTILQTLVCGIQKSGKIDFKFKSEDILHQRSETTFGTAKLLSSRETDIDDAGNPYAVTEYEYVKHYTARIRIDSEQRRAKVKMIKYIDKDTLHGLEVIELGNSKIESVGIMNRTK